MEQGLRHDYIDVAIDIRLIADRLVGGAQMHLWRDARKEAGQGGEVRGGNVEVFKMGRRAAEGGRRRRSCQVSVPTSLR